MNKNNRFQRSSRPTFTCAICHRRTRLTGQGNNELCQQCWELAGLENHILDGGDMAEIAFERDEHFTKALELGSDPALIKAAFSTLWPTAR